MDNLKQMYEDGLSLPQISKLVGIPVSTVRRRLIVSGVPMRSKKESLGIASKDGRLGTGRLGKKFSMSQQQKEKLSKAMLARGEIFAAGVTLKRSGYMAYTRGKNKHRNVHVVVMEEHIGRKLMPNEVVHHIDENKQNNSIENLALMTSSAHAKLHRLLDALRGKSRKRKENGRFY